MHLCCLIHVCQRVQVLCQCSLAKCEGRHTFQLTEGLVPSENTGLPVVFARHSVLQDLL